MLNPNTEFGIYILVFVVLVVEKVCAFGAELPYADEHSAPEKPPTLNPTLIIPFPPRLACA